MKNILCIFHNKFTILRRFMELKILLTNTRVVNEMDGKCDQKMYKIFVCEELLLDGRRDKLVIRCVIYIFKKNHCFRKAIIICYIESWQ